MSRVAMLAIALACGACEGRRDARELQGELAALAASYQPLIDELFARIHHLKRDMHGQPGWEDAFRVAQLANDKIGLPPFEQTAPPGPEFRNSPGSLLGL